METERLMMQLPQEVNNEVSAVTEDAPVQSRISAARPRQTNRLAIARRCRRSCQPSYSRVHRCAITSKGNLIPGGLQSQLRC